MDLFERISRLKPGQQKLLELTLIRQGVDIRQIPITTEYGKNHPHYPLTLEQEPMWVIEKLDPDNPSYDAPGTVSLEGNLNPELLERSINEVVKRHDILRAIFITDREKPVQVILPSLTLPLEHIDLTGLPGDEQENRMKQLRKDSRLYRFDLAGGPLVKTLLVELGQDRYIFITIMHHIVGDLLSLKIFLKEVAWYYTFYSQGQAPAPALPVLSCRYVDYACWQRRWYRESLLGRETLKQQEPFWLEMFQAEIPVLNLPTDYPRPALKSYKGAHGFFNVKKEKLKVLKEIFLKENTTLYMVLLSIFYVFLAKISGQEDIVVGFPINTRQNKTLKDMIGLLVKTVPLRNYPRGGKTFREFLTEVNSSVLNVFQNQDYPYKELVKKRLPGRDPSRNPLFDVLFNFIYIDMSEIEMPGLTVKPYRFKPQRVGFDLELVCEGTYEELFFKLSYGTKLFKEETVNRFISYYQNALAVAINDLEVRIADIVVIPGEEQKQVLFDFNNTASPYPQQKTIAELAAGQVLKTPHHIAALFADQILSYRALGETYHRLAELLQTKGVGPGVIVAIIIDRSLELLTWIMAILKAGGAYLPIDPDWPANRIEFMLKDSSAKILLAGDRAKAIDFAEEIIYLSSSSPRALSSLSAGHLLNFPIAPPPPFPPSRPSSLAYLIYTSGSTGKPKGVMVEQTPVVNLLIALNRYYPSSSDGTYLLKTSYCFDVSVAELFGWFPGGSRLAVIEKNHEKDPVMLLKAIRKNNVTHINFVPAMFSAFVDYLSADKGPVLSGLKYIFLAGEVILPDLVNRFRTLNCKVRLENLYGPTEATVYTSGYSLANWDGREYIPIGTPLQNIKIYLLDKHQSPVPLGVGAELHIAGTGLARGYLNNPELTHERFINYKLQNTYYKIHITNKIKHLARRTPSLTQTTNTNTLYKTGDLALWLRDGNIKFLGRIDSQVKIRGYRIEPEEIRQQLLKSPKIENAVVVSLEKAHNNENKYLCAYIVPSYPPSPTSTELKEYLSRSLPGFMIPAYFVPLDRIPLTSSGKVDRNALPVPEIREEANDYEGPRDEIEKMLVEIWSEVLGIEKISTSSTQGHRPPGINDNFFRLGGDSIKIIQVAARLKKYQLDLSVNDFFLHPVIKTLKNFVKKTERIIPQGNITGEIPLTPIQHWFFHHDFPGKHHFNQAVMLFRKEKIAETTLKKVFSKILDHHDALRIVFDRREGDRKPLVQWNRPVGGKRFDLEVFNLEGKDITDIEKEIARETASIQRGIDLKTGPLVKLGLFKTSGGDHLLIVIHHLVVDGISWRILLEDLITGHKQVEKGEKIQFQAKTDSFQYWSEKLSQYAAGSESPPNSDLFKELAYWQEIETQKPAPLPRNAEISGDKKRAAYSDTISVNLDKDETGTLFKKTNRAYNTEVNDLLLTALGMALKEWAGVEKQLVNLEGHGRESIMEHVDIGRTIGWFTTRYPVILDMSETGDISSAIKNTKETLRRIPHKGIGYGILKYLTPEEKKQGYTFNLEPEIGFNYLGQFQLWQENDNPAELLQISRVNPGPGVSPAMEKQELIDINGIQIKGELHLSFTYNRYAYNQEHIGTLANLYKSHLLRIIRHCVTLEPPGYQYTPSDFPLVKINQPWLDRTVANYRSKNMEIEDIYGLSPSQQSMIFHHLYSPGSSVTVEQQVLKIESGLKPGAFKEAWQALLDRHASLRASFHWKGVEEPLQVIHQGLTVPFTVLDWQHVSPGRWKSRFSRFLASDREQGFDLREPPLLRLTVIKLEETLFRVVWTYHHLLLDGWSQALLIQELAGLYETRRQGKETGPPPPAPFKDYIGWLKKQDISKAGDFWRENLKGFSAPILISKNLPSREEPGDNRPFGEMGYRFPEAVQQRFSAFTREYGITLNTLLQGSWALLLHHYSGERDMVFGTTVSGRPPQLPGVLTMIGCFMNTIPLRIEVPPAARPGPWLQQIQLNHSRCRQFEYTGLANIRACSQIPRLSGLYDLYDTIVVFENYPLEFEKKEGIWCADNSYQLEEQMDYPLILYGHPTPTLSLKFLFDTRFFNRDTVNRLVQHLVFLLEEITGTDHRCLGEIPRLTREEARLLTLTWNDTAADYPREKTIIQLFIRQVEAAPDNIALVFADHHLTYGDLNKKANPPAWALRTRGIGINRAVALKAERSLELVTGILAILKAGCAYLPLAPDTPREREEFMRKDTAAEILLTQPHLAEQEENTLFIDNRTPSSQNDANPDIINKPGDLAYIIYTSGTTGHPKGILVQHRNVVNLLTWFGQQYHLARGLQVMLSTDYLFDPSIEQVLGTLLHGGKLFIVKWELMMDKEEFQKFIAAKQIQLINFIPQVLTELLLSPGEKLTSLLAVISGGDRLEDPVKDELLRQGYPLFNHYGPTEITVDALTSTCSQEKVNLGKPIANTRVYILGSQYRLVPIGVPGEMCISGAGVTRGYLNHPELTAERFINYKLQITGKEVPFGRKSDTCGDILATGNTKKRVPSPQLSQKPARKTPSLTPNANTNTIYRTGDLARWLTTGNIEFIGRIDQQIKIRGFRIEPAEIEGQLLGVEKIKQVVVAVKENEKGEKYLWAYFIAPQPVETLKLKEALLKNVPFYMIPAGFIQLETLPLNPNGKVDLRALPGPGMQEMGGYEAPVTPAEKQLARLWSETLAVDETLIDINANFFDLGGQSIMAMRLMSLIKEVFRVKIPLASFFQPGNIKDMARLITVSQAAGKGAGDEGPSLAAVKFRKKKRKEIEV